jgi:acyl-coenzyme A synthetase/AMP-(fatty) acid ligase
MLFGAINVPQVRVSTRARGSLDFTIVLKNKTFLSLVKNIFVMSRTDNATANEPGDIILEEALKSMPIESVPEPVESDHHLFILYTSGPKCLAD